VHLCAECRCHHYLGLHITFRHLIWHLSIDLCRNQSHNLVVNRWGIPFFMPIWVSTAIATATLSMLHLYEVSDTSYMASHRSQYSDGNLDVSSSSISIGFVPFVMAPAVVRPRRGTAVLRVARRITVGTPRQVAAVGYTPVNNNSAESRLRATEIPRILMLYGIC
jgi:hypothetical protein